MAGWLKGGSISGYDIVSGFIFRVEEQERISDYTNEDFIMAAGMTKQEEVSLFTRYEEFVNICKVFGIISYSGYTEDGQ